MPMTLKDLRDQLEKLATELPDDAEVIVSWGDDCSGVMYPTEAVSIKLGTSDFSDEAVPQCMLYCGGEKEEDDDDMDEVKELVSHYDRMMEKLTAFGRALEVLKRRAQRLDSEKPNGKKRDK
jgi:hypothetical protein